MSYLDPSIGEGGTGIDSEYGEHLTDVPIKSYRVCFRENWSINMDVWNQFFDNLYDDIETIVGPSGYITLYQINTIDLASDYDIAASGLLAREL